MRLNKSLISSGIKIFIFLNLYVVYIREGGKGRATKKKNFFLTLFLTKKQGGGVRP